MLRRGAWQGLVVAVLVCGSALPAMAGAWNQPKGSGQVIVKYEPVWSIQRFDQDGDRVSLEEERLDQVVSVWAEYGVSDKVTLLLKTDWQDADDGFHSYRGQGPTEFGARWLAWSGERTVVSVQASYITDSEGRNEAWGSHGEGREEADLRVLVGGNFGTTRPGFYELQLARHWKDGLSEETRLEGTAGVHFKERYTSIIQFYSGKADLPSEQGGARWTTIETGVIRHQGAWSGQVGWRATVAGRNVPAGDGPIVALWRRF